METRVGGVRLYTKQALAIFVLKNSWCFNLPRRTNISVSVEGVLRAQTLDASVSLTLCSSLCVSPSIVDDIVRHINIPDDRVRRMRVSVCDESKQLRHLDQFPFLSSLLLWSKTSTTTEDFALSFLSFVYFLVWLRYSLQSIERWNRNQTVVFSALFSLASS